MDKRIILTVRATADGVYGNYLYKGPIESDQGYTAGDVFQVDATPYEVLDDKKKPVYALDEDKNKIPLMDTKGRQITDDKGHKMFKIKMATFFSKNWMERVADDTELTYPDRPKWKIPDAYKIKKNKPVKTVELPSDLASLAGVDLPSVVSQAMPSEPKLEEVI